MISGLLFGVWDFGACGLWGAFAFWFAVSLLWGACRLVYACFWFVFCGWCVLVGLLFLSLVVAGFAGFGCLGVISLLCFGFDVWCGFVWLVVVFMLMC